MVGLNHYYNLLEVCEYIENHFQYEKFSLEKTPWGSFIFNVIENGQLVVFIYDETVSAEYNMYYSLFYQNQEFSFLGNLYDTFLNFTFYQLPKIKNENKRI